LHGDTKVSETELTGGGEAVVSILEGDIIAVKFDKYRRQLRIRPLKVILLKHTDEPNKVVFEARSN
jgi:hypothetical protein